MYRVLVVDDEEPVLESFSYVIDDHSKDFRVCGRARSGQEAIALMNEQNPDLVFMDVHMPGMDGIDTIVHLKERHPQAVFILATAYERFDVARRVIPLNIFSYLVKPVTKPRLLAELQRTKAHLDSLNLQRDTRIQETQLIRESTSETVRAFLLSIRHRPPTSAEWQRFCAAASFAGSSAVLGVGTCLNRGRDPNFEQELDDLGKALQYKQPCVHAAVGNEILVLFPLDEKPDRIEAAVDSLLRSRKQLAFHLSSRVEPKALHRAYQDLAAKLAGETAGVERTAWAGLAGPGKAAWAGRTASVHAGNSPALGTTNPLEIVERILKAPPEAAGRLFEEYWNRVFAKYPFDLAKGKMIGFVSLLQSQGGFGEPDAAESIMPLDNEEAWLRWTRFQFPILLQAIQDESRKELSPILSLAVEHIRAHFQDDLDLDRVATACKVSPSYLSRLFGSHFGYGFIEYLNQIRIGEAQKLLRKPGTRIKDVARLVGFRDPNYFSRVFRKIVGVSPTAKPQEAKQ